MRDAATPSIPRLLATREEAATALRLCARTIDVLIKRGELAVVREGKRVLIPTSAMESYIAKRIEQATH